MWLRFKNNVLVNLEKVVKIEYTEYGPGVVFHCVDTSFRLVLKNLETKAESQTESVWIKDDF